MAKSAKVKVIAAELFDASEDNFSAGINFVEENSGYFVTVYWEDTFCLMVAAEDTLPKEQMRELMREELGDDED